jgi:hypothetical protein
MSMTDEEKLVLAKDLLERFVLDESGFAQSEATAYLEGHEGFEVEWVLNREGDILLLLLWKYSPDPLHAMEEEFIIEFAGHDANIVSVFNLAKSVQL